jgi:N-acetylmuramoyl-L-alanine amidase
MLNKKTISLFSIFSLINLFCIASFSQTPKKLKTIVVDAGHGGHDNGATGQYENSLRSKEKDVTLAISKKVVAELKKQLPELNIVPTRTTDIYQPVNDKARIANEYKGDLFLCIHADSGPLKTGRRQIGTRTVTRYKVTYTGKGKKRKKKSTPYQVTEPVYEYFKLPLKASGTSVYIFAAHKTSAKLKAIMDEVGEFEIETNEGDSTYTPIDFSSPGNKTIAQIYATRYQMKSDLLASMVNDEVEKTGRIALGVNQRQVGIAVLQATSMPAILIETGFINNPEDERYINSESGQQEMAEAITQAVIRYKEQLENPTKTVINK